LDEDHRIPLAELKCMSPKRVKQLDFVFGFGVRGPAEGGGAGPILLPPRRPARRSAKLVPIFLEG
jgi:hypothetical protein